MVLEKCENQYVNGLWHIAEFLKSLHFGAPKWWMLNYELLTNTLLWIPFITLLGSFRSCHLKLHQNSVCILPAWTQYSSVVNFNIDSAFTQNKYDAELRVVHIPFDNLMVLVKCREKPITLAFALLTRQIKDIFKEWTWREKKGVFYKILKVLQISK